MLTSDGHTLVMCENTELKVKEMKVLRVRETIGSDRGFREQNGWIYKHALSTLLYYE
jgi:hypothetical protein